MTRLFPAVAIATLLILAACSDSSDNNPPPAGDVTAYSAELYRTAGGVPHVVGDDWGSVGYGTGYSDAQDNVCITARNLLKVRAQLSEYFGPGEGNRNSDLFYAMLAANGTFDAAIDPEWMAMFTGYAAGFNRYLRDTGIDNLPDPACRGADWIVQMAVEDLQRIHLTPAFLPNFLPLLFPTPPPLAVSKTEPGSEQTATDGRTPAFNPGREADLLALVGDITSSHDKGSNGVAIGRDFSVNKRGLLYTNPHLGPDLTFRFVTMHQVMPGVFNLLGAKTYDRANVGFGTNGDVAWTNTVSASTSFSWYKLDLVPGNHFSYFYDGEERPITGTEVSIKVKGDDGSITEESHTFYSSHYGPMLGLIFTWGPNDEAWSMRIADEGARGWQGGALALQRSSNVREMKDVLTRFTHMPGTNIVAADSAGDTLYVDSSPTANLSDQQLDDCQSSGAFGPEYTGNTSACEWRTDEDSAAPGLVGAGRQPFLFRTDYVTNSNDDPWLANPAQPITGFPRVYGDVEEERTLRTRAGLQMMTERQGGTDGLPGNLFNTDYMIDRMLSNQHFAGGVLRDDLVKLCRDNPEVDLGGVVGGYQRRLRRVGELGSLRGAE